MKRNLLIAGILSAATLVGCAKQNAKVDLTESGQGIIGGVIVDPNDAVSKTIVAVYNVSLGALCTGSIINNQFVLTAAHCVEGETGPASPADLRIVFGTDVDTRNVIVRKVTDFQQTPFWATRQNEDLDTGDVSIVKFDGGLPAGYGPAQMLGNPSALTKGVTVTLAGYGISNGVTAVGAGKLRRVDVAVENPAFSKTEVLLNQTQGRGACHGDSGGPAYVKAANGALLLWGVTSRGVRDPKNDCGAYSAYTNVLAYTKWMSDAMGNMIKAPTLNAFRPATPAKTVAQVH